MLRTFLFLFLIFKSTVLFATGSPSNAQNFCDALNSVCSQKNLCSGNEVDYGVIKQKLSDERSGALPTGESFASLINYGAFLHKEYPSSSSESLRLKNEKCMEEYSRLSNLNPKHFLSTSLSFEKNTLNSHYKAMAADSIVNRSFGSDLTTFVQAPSLNTEQLEHSFINDCQELNEYQCQVNDSDFEQLNTYFQNLDYTKQCKCLPKKLEIIYAGKFQELKRESEKKFQDAVQKKLGEKLLNDFSSYFEDMSYFAANSKEFFGEKKKHQDSKSNELKCIDPKLYSKAIDHKCKGKISADERQKRIDNIFSTFSPNKSNVNLQEGFSALVKKINHLDEEKIDSFGTPYTRLDHDKARHSLALTDQQFIFIDQLIRKIVIEPSSRKLIEESTEVPALSIIKILETKIKENSVKFISDFVDPKEVGSELHKVFQNSLNDPKGIVDGIKMSFQGAIGLHPGIDSIMRDKNLLLKAVDNAKKKGKSLLKSLEGRDSVLLSKFEHDCKSFIDHFSSAVCFDPNKLQSLISGDDIYSLLGPESRKNDFSRLLVCEASNDVTTEPFKNLLLNDPSKKTSDFLDRMKNPVDKQVNSFRKMYQGIKNGDRDLTDVVADSIRMTGLSNGVDADFFSGHSSDFVNSFVVPFEEQAIKSGESFSKEETASNFNNSASSSPHDKGSVGSDIPNSAFGSNNIDYSNSKKEETHSSARELVGPDLENQFRETFSNSKNREKIEELLPQTDSSMLKELMKLKDENSKAQDRLNKILAEQDKLKLKELESKIKELEEQKKVLEAPVKSARPISKNTTPSNHGGYHRDFSNGSFEKFHLANNNSLPSRQEGASSGRQSEGPQSSKLNSNGRSYAQAFRQRDPFVLSSPEKSLGVEVKQKDVGDELLKYIENNSLDSQTLLNIRGSDIVYRYKMIENGVSVEKEVVVDYKSLHPDVKKKIDDRLISQGVDLKTLDQIDNRISEMKRKHTYHFLRSIIMETGTR